MELFFSFSGRLGRAHWWLAQFVNLVLIVGSVTAISMAYGAGMSTMTPSEMMPAAIVMICVVLLCVWINIATTMKRYHDRNKSGFWVAVSMIPYVGAIWQVIECGCLPGTPGENDYGQSLNGSVARSDALAAEIAELRENSAPAPRYASEMRAMASPDAHDDRSGFGLRGA